MKKNIGNDKVIRAMAIGISAMLAASTPLTALAAEGEEGTGNTNPDPAGETNTTSSDICNDAQEKADEASEAVDKAEGSAVTVKTDVETNVEKGEAGLSDDGKDLAQNVIDAAADVDSTTLTGAETDITNADIKLDEAEAKDGLSNGAYDKAADAAGKAAGIAEDVNNAMNTANDNMDEQLGELQNATTIADANAAYSELEATANAAQEEFNTKLEAYNDAKNAYDAAVADIAKYEEEYNKAIASADANAVEAQKKLEEAKANAEALEEAVAAAKDAVGESAKEAMLIADMEKLTQEDGGLNWKNEDKLFIAIMENYYLPEKLDITGATVTRVQGKDNNEYNYFKAVYTENGEEKVKYFNYKMDGKSKDDIVIFEKREVEIFGGAADQYVDSDGKVIDTAAGLKDGTIVGVNDEYIVKNNLTDSKTLVSDSKVTGTSKEDVSVDESTKQESWKYDAETGELVKTVTADVTTITYTDATFTSDKSYATDAERDAAAEAKKAELEEETGKDASINETETYVATGKYIPTFTKQINIDDSYSNYSKSGAIDEAKEDVLDDFEDYHVIESEFNVSATKLKEGYIFEDKYQVTGNVTVTYAQVTKVDIDIKWWNEIGYVFNDSELKKFAKDWVTKQGGIYHDAYSWNGDWKQATIEYVAPVTISGEAKDNEADAKEALNAAIAEALKSVTAPKGGEVSSKLQKVDVDTTYSYTVDYLKKDTETTETKAVATETYGNAEKLTGEIIQNKNYYDAINNGKMDKILLTQNDDDYRAFVDDAKDLTGKYDRLLEEAKQANKDVATAQEEVDALKAAIEALKEKSNNSKALASLEEKLDFAQINLNNAKETRGEILKKLEGAGVTLDDVINRLTPPATTGGADGTTGGGTGTGTTTTTTPGTTTLAAGNVVAAPVATTTTTTTTPAPAAANVVAIEDEDTPLAATVDEAGDDANESGDEDQNAIVAIEDEDTPLVASVEKDKVSWWWWLILVILGATGYEMYRKHQEKKKAAAEAEDAE